MAVKKCRRARDHILGFVMSPEEAAILKCRVNLTGLTQQAYVLGCLFRQPLSVAGTPRVYRRMQMFLDEAISSLETSREMPGDVTLNGVLFLVRIYEMLIRA